MTPDEPEAILQQLAEALAQPAPPVADVPFTLDGGELSDAEREAAFRSRQIDLFA